MSRTFECFDHLYDGVEGFITISRGKTTSSRAMAERVSDLVCHKLGSTAPCRTGTARSAIQEVREEVTMERLEYRGWRRAGRWFDVRRRKLGSWAYALNRITGIGLVVYLSLHLVVLSLLLQGPGSWNTFVALARSPYVLVLDVILFAGALIHGLNSVRVALTSFSIGIRVQKALFSTVMIVSVVALAFVAFKVFGG